FPEGGHVPGPLDHAGLLTRPDVTTFRTDRLTAPCVIAGPVRLEVWFSSSAVDTDVVAKLLDFYPDGRVLPVAEGALRARYREGLDREVLLTPDQPTKLAVDLGPVAHRLEPGHRLGLLITSSNFPALDRNLNTGEPVG